MYNFLMSNIEREYDLIRVLKDTELGCVSMLRHRSSGGRYIFRRFEGSAEVCRKLIGMNCPNLPRIYDAAEKDGQSAVLEEYIQGDSLDFLLEGELCSGAEARDIAMGICRGLWVLHSLGAVHRDIKPENVIIRGDEAVLIDFNASRLHKLSAASDTRVLGTMGYAAPEQFGFSQTDHRADIYSMGVLLNVMLTGQHPSRSLAPGKMGRVIQKCTMTSPSKRYADILQLMENL